VTPVEQLPPLTVTTAGIPPAEHLERPVSVVPDSAWNLPDRGSRDVPWEAGVLLLLIMGTGAALSPHGDSSAGAWISPSSAFAAAPAP
jgi:hypothetical protein